VTVTGGSNKRVSLAALIAVRPGHPPRLIYRVHDGRRRRGDKRKGFTEATPSWRVARIAHGGRRRSRSPAVHARTPGS
jgi:hypothetical protein